MAIINTTPGYTWVNDELVTYAKLRAAARPTWDSDNLNLNTAAAGLDPQRNLLHNPDFDIWQMGTTFTQASTPFDNDDDEYVADRWVLLSDGDDVLVVARTDGSGSQGFVPEGSIYGLRAAVRSAGRAKKFGFLQILTNRDTMKLRGQSISASLLARTDVLQNQRVIDNIRITILEWTGTADAVTSDVVSAWNGAGNEPSYVSNWASIKESGNSELSTSAYTVHKAENATVGTGANNLAVFVYIDDTDLASSSYLFLGQMQLEVGETMTVFAHPGRTRDWLHCLYFLEYIKGITMQHDWQSRPSQADRVSYPVKFFSKRLVTPSLTTKKISETALQSGNPSALVKSSNMMEVLMSADGTNRSISGKVDVWVKAQL